MKLDKQQLDAVARKIANSQQTKAQLDFDTNGENTINFYYKIYESKIRKDLEKLFITVKNKYISEYSNHIYIKYDEVSKTIGLELGYQYGGASDIKTVDERIKSGIKDAVKKKILSKYNTNLTEIKDLLIIEGINANDLDSLIKSVEAKL